GAGVADISRMRDVSFCFSEFAYSFIGKTSSFFQGASPHDFTYLSSPFFFSAQEKEQAIFSITCSFS
ncbi:hypothetical protein, partial [Cohnella luojiensis]|uniref:hypothetical protein n=1 Tax=Cohnella luojiensis TaxID=652876 RepID=UPI00196A7DD2